MSRPLRIAMFVGSFPVISETFIVRQIIGLLDLGHDVDIYADTRTEPAAPVHPEVARERLLERTTFMDLPPETAPWEMPVWPVTGRAWPPGSETSIHNSVRVARAIPKLLTCLVKAPRLTFQVLSPSQYRYQAASLSALYRLAALCARPKQYDVLHAHFGPVGNSFRFAKELWRAPMAVSFHGYDFSTLPRKEGKDMYRKLFETVDAVTVNSEFTRQQVEKLGCPAAKLYSLPVGLDPVEFPFRERKRDPGQPVRILTLRHPRRGKTAPTTSGNSLRYRRRRSSAREIGGTGGAARTPGQCRLSRRAGQRGGADIHGRGAHFRAGEREC
ncbi:MAG: hypothetical protein DME18_10830 [Verrucomicrobia bacterium]|nr:MAG: hypothetical protein DME18_10830 [Verrucomicrobiota bacterium]